MPENLSTTDTGSVMVGLKTKNSFWGGGSGRAQALQRRRVTHERRPGSAAASPPCGMKVRQSVVMSLTLLSML